MARAPVLAGGMKGLAAMLAVCAALAGCSTGGEPSQALVAPVVLPGFSHAVPGKPVDLYVRIARLGKACWFTPPAPLQVGYVFTADVSPESKGGVASIVIYERNKAAARGATGERGLKAFEVTLSPSGEGTAIGVDNGRIPEAFADRMQRDINRWAAGETSCGSSVWATSAAMGESAPAVTGSTAASKLWRTSTH